MDIPRLTFKVNMSGVFSLNPRSCSDSTLMESRIIDRGWVSSSKTVEDWEQSVSEIEMDGKAGSWGSPVWKAGVSLGNSFFFLLNGWRVPDQHYPPSGSEVLVFLTWLVGPKSSLMSPHHHPDLEAA